MVSKALTMGVMALAVLGGAQADTSNAAAEVQKPWEAFLVSASQPASNPKCKRNVNPSHVLVDVSLLVFGKSLQTDAAGRACHGAGFGIAAVAHVT